MKIGDDASMVRRLLEQRGGFKTSDIVNALGVRDETIDAMHAASNRRIREEPASTDLFAGAPYFGTSRLGRRHFS